MFLVTHQFLMYNPQHLLAKDDWTHVVEDPELYAKKNWKDPEMAK